MPAKRRWLLCLTGRNLETTRSGDFLIPDASSKFRQALAQVEPGDEILVFETQSRRFAALLRACPECTSLDGEVREAFFRGEPVYVLTSDALPAQEVLPYLRCPRQLGLRIPSRKGYSPIQEISEGDFEFIKVLMKKKVKEAPIVH